jgi:anthranilate synthase component 2
MIAIIDNYDSFTYNLYQYVGEIDPDIRVFRNDEVGPSELLALDPDAVIISPGPGRPADAGRCIEIVQQVGPNVPILGVCLGHQAICEAYGATITYAAKLMHGKQSDVMLNVGCPMFAGLPDHVKVARYHSLAVDPETLPECLKVRARSEDWEVMAVQHVEHPVIGVQFHPESVMTQQGKRMMRNFIQYARRFKAEHAA